MKRAVLVLAFVAASAPAAQAGQGEQPSLSLHAPAIVTSGEAATFSGTLTGAPECIADRTILFERTVHGTGLASSSTLGRTDEAGNFSSPIPVQVSADYMAVTARSGECPIVTSERTSVLARARVTARASSDRLPKGSAVMIGGNVHPGHPGTRVVLERRVDGAWNGVRRVTLPDTSLFAFPLKVTWTGYRSYRVVWPSQDADHEEGRSARIRIRGVAQR